MPDICVAHPVNQWLDVAFRTDRPDDGPSQLTFVPMLVDVDAYEVPPLTFERTTTTNNNTTNNRNKKNQQQFWNSRRLSLCERRRSQAISLAAQQALIPPLGKRVVVYTKIAVVLRSSPSS
jgi:hypothetical protein